MDTERFDKLTRTVGIWFGLGTGDAKKLLRILAALMFDAEQGGFKAFIGRFQNAGLTRLLHSWIGAGANEPITPSQVEKVFGAEILSRIGQELRVNPANVADAIGAVLPDLVSALASDGTMPADIPDEIASWLRAGGADTVAHPRGGRWIWSAGLWLMFVALLVLVGLAMQRLRAHGLADEFGHAGTREAHRCVRRFFCDETAQNGVQHPYARRSNADPGLIRPPEVAPVAERRRIDAFAESLRPKRERQWRGSCAGCLH